MPDEIDKGDSTNSPDEKTKDAELGNMVNAAVTAHLKRFAEKTLPDLLGKHLETALKPLHEKIAAPPPPPPDSEGEGNTKKKSTNSPEIAALQAKLDEALRAGREAEEKRVAAEKKARDDRAFADLRAALGSSVKPELLELLANDLFYTKKRVEVQDDGSVLFKSTRNVFGVDEEVAMPLKDGVEAFLKTEAAKPFLPAPTQNVNTVPPIKRLPPTANPSNGPQDFSKLQPSDLAREAMRLERELQAKLAANNLKI